MSNNYCLKASGKQIVELARLMDVHSRRTGFDEPILYLGDACRLEPVIIAFVPRMPCMEKQPTMPGSRLENGKFHNKRA